jgi:hypothetical protein
MHKFSASGAIRWRQSRARYLDFPRILTGGFCNRLFTGQLLGDSFGTSLTDNLNFTNASVGVPGTTNGQAGGLTPVDQDVVSSNGADSSGSP